MNKNSYINYNSRAVVQPATTDDEKRSVESILTSETPVTVFDFYRWDFIREVLMLDGMDKVKKIPLIDAHDRSTSKNVIGSTTDFRIEELEDGTKVVRATNVFSKVENDLYEKVREGHIDSTSVGYRVYEEDTLTVKPGKTIEYNGRAWTNEDDKKDLIIRKRWTPMENSLVPIGADEKSKFRAANTAHENRVKENETQIDTDNKTSKAKNDGIMDMNTNIFKRLK